MSNENEMFIDQNMRSLVFDLKRSSDPYEKFQHGDPVVISKSHEIYVNEENVTLYLFGGDTGFDYQCIEDYGANDVNDTQVLIRTEDCMTVQEMFEDEALCMVPALGEADDSSKRRISKLHGGDLETVLKEIGAEEAPSIILPAGYPYGVYHIEPALFKDFEDVKDKILAIEVLDHASWLKLYLQGPKMVLMLQFKDNKFIIQHHIQKHSFESYEEMITHLKKDLLK